MTDIPGNIAPQPSVKSRSLFQLAALRFKRNKAAMAGSVMLLLITLFSFIGPHFLTHTYDQVFSSYVSVPPSLEPRPDVNNLQDVMEALPAGRASS